MTRAAMLDELGYHFLEHRMPELAVATSTAATLPVALAVLDFVAREVNAGLGIDTVHVINIGPVGVALGLGLHGSEERVAVETVQVEIERVLGLPVSRFVASLEELPRDWSAEVLNLVGRGSPVRFRARSMEGPDLVAAPFEKERRSLREMRQRLVQLSDSSAPDELLARLDLLRRRLRTVTAAWRESFDVAWAAFEDATGTREAAAASEALAVLRELVDEALRDLAKTATREP